MSAATKAQLQELIECQKETIAIQAKTIVEQKTEINHASEQITAICEGIVTIAENNAQTRAMVEEVSAAIQRDQPISEGWWN